MELTENDLRFVAQRLPRDVRDLLGQHAGRLFLGGGFIRAVVAGEEINDIDLFGVDAGWLKTVASALESSRKAHGDRTTLHFTANAVTLLTPNRLTVQFITRWNFTEAQALVDSFDFTVCQAAVWRDGAGSASAWRSLTGSEFYQDLAARRLTYTSPQREEEPGGSMLRVLKYVKRGYSIQVKSLGAVIARMASRVQFERTGHDESSIAHVVSGMLRDVDPSLVVDGMDVLSETEDDEAA